jgi:hypothetical protein
MPPFFVLLLIHFYLFKKVLSCLAIFSEINNRSKIAANFERRFI